MIGALRPAYETFLNLAFFGKGIPYAINGAVFRVSPFHRHLLGHEYDADIANFLSQRIRPGDLCLDVGANVGVYALQLARWTGVQGKVIAFEPNPAARAVLERHVAWNHFDGLIQIEPFAISDEEGMAEIFAAGADGKARLVQANPQIDIRGGPLTIQVTTLGKYCEKYALRPDWIVLDIEGFEIRALLGMEDYLVSLNRSPGLIIEMHPSLWASAGTSPTLAREVFERLGLKPEPLSQQKDVWTEHGSIFARVA